MRSLIKITALPAAISLHMLLRLVFTPAISNDMSEAGMGYQAPVERAATASEGELVLVAMSRTGE
jgi:hypothetical protein